MPTRSLQWRGFGITLRVPDQIARAAATVFRRASPAFSTEDRGEARLVVRQPPRIELSPRDPEQALAFIKSATQTDRLSEPTGSGSDRNPIGSLPWYHTIELPGAVTPGLFDHRALVPFYGLPDDLRGQRVLDVASFDGFWSFELERRGAQVTAVDIDTSADVDLPRAARDLAMARGLQVRLRHGIELARSELGSNVELITLNVYDLDPDKVGHFDFVHAGDLLLHLRDPALALERIRSVTAGEALISDVFDPELDHLGSGPGLTRHLGGWTDATWWMPALSTLTQMVADAGFSRVKVSGTYNLPPRTADRGVWRAIIRAQS